MNPKKILLLLTTVFCFCSFFTSGQFKELKFKRFSKEAGLSNSNFTCFAQTEDGFLWIGTTDGLNRFDGYSFKVYRNDPSDAHSISDNHISTLFVDHQGELWAGTENNGLSKYDRRTDTFMNYKSKIYDTSTLSSHYITSITEDADQNLWVGTIMGLNLYNRKQQNFTRYFFEMAVSISDQTIDSLTTRAIPGNITTALGKLKHREFKNERAFLRTLGKDISKSEIDKYSTAILKYAQLRAIADNIRTLQADRNGNIWLGYAKDGLGYFNPTTNKLKTYRHNPKEPGSIGDDEVMSLYLESNHLWIGTRKGTLSRWNANTDDFTHYALPDKAYNIEALTVDSRGTLWVGDDYGLLRYDKKDKKFYRYQNQENNKYSLSSTAVKAIFEDRQDNLWIGCSQGGINLTIGNVPFEHFKHNPNSRGSLSKNSISSVLEDSEGNVWIGYYTMGIDVLNRKTNQVVHYTHNSANPTGLGKGTVFAIFEDKDKNIWVGTYEGGLQMFDKTTEKFISYKHNPNDAQSIGGNDIRAIAEDADGTLWLAIHGHGVNAFDKKTKTATRYTARYLDWQNSLANDWVYTLFIDKQENIWAGSVFGVSILKKGAKDFVSYNKENRNLSHNNVRSILEDSDGNVWIGTENGLNLFNPETTNFTVFTEKDGLPNNAIHGILEDKQGHLWMSTNHGLSKFNADQGSFINYNALDGLQSDEFFPGAYFRGKSGTLYFGGVNGLTTFNPENVQNDSSEVLVRLTGLSLFNQPVEPGNDILTQPLDQTSHITLEHDQNVVGLSFVGLNFRNPEKIQLLICSRGSRIGGMKWDPKGRLFTQTSILAIIYLK